MPIDFEARVRRTANVAFGVGKRKLNRSKLELALKSRVEKAVFQQVSEAINVVSEVLHPDLVDILMEVLKASGKIAAKNLRNQLRTAEMKAAQPKIDFKFDVTNPEAVRWVEEHALDVVEGMSEYTREQIRDLIDEAFDGEFDVHDLAEQIEDLIGDSSRAEVIARTETMRASNEGQLQAWDQAVEAGLLTGLEKKEWIVTPDDRLCPICEPMEGATEELDGQFDVEGEKVDGPPAHPNCRCTIALSV